MSILDGFELVCLKGRLCKFPGARAQERNTTESPKMERSKLDLLARAYGRNTKARWQKSSFHDQSSIDFQTPRRIVFELGQLDRASKG